MRHGGPFIAIPFYMSKYIKQGPLLWSSKSIVLTAVYSFLAIALWTASLANANEIVVPIPKKAISRCEAILTDLSNRFGSRKSSKNDLAITDPLQKLREEFGPELREASQFEVEFTYRGTNSSNHNKYWYNLNKDLEVKFCEAGGSHGYWLIRTADKKHYALAAELPRARKITDHVLPALIPDGFVRSADRKTFLPQNTKDNGVDPQPTVDNLNRKHNLNSKTSAAVLAVAMNPRITNMFGMVPSIEFIEYISRGQIPVAYGWPYNNNVRIAERILELSKATDWMRFRQILTTAIEATHNSELMAHEQHQAQQILADAYWLIFKALNPTFFSDRKNNPLSNSEYFNQGLQVLENKLQAVPTTSPSNSQEEQQLLHLRPSDLALFINNWKFESITAAQKEEYWFFYWMKNKISRSYDSSNHSIPYERLQLVVWTHLQFPTLNEIQIPPDLNAADGYQWWIREVEKHLGPRISIRKVPYSYTEAYHQAAVKIFFENFRFESFERAANDGTRFDSRTKTSTNQMQAELAILKLEGDISQISLAQVKAAYRKEAMKYHPDLNNSSEASLNEMKALNNAYDTLKKYFNP